jgi:hypothetical protein
MEDVTTSAPASGAPESFGAMFDAAVADDTSADTTSETTEQVEDTDAGELTEETSDALPAEADNEQVEEPEAAAEETAEPPKPEGIEEDGVKERVRADGRKEYVLKESRYKNFHEAYTAIRDVVEPVIGEPLTREAIEARQNAFVDQQSIITDFLSGDPSNETNVLNFFAEIAGKAKQAGEVAHDPLVNLAARIPDFFGNNQQAYTALAKPILQGEFASLKQIARDRVAANKDDDALALSIEHIEKALFGQHEPREKFLKAPDPVDARLREVEERERRLNEQQTSERQRQWTEFSKQTNTDIRTSVTGAVDEALKDVAKSYEAFPEDFKAVKDSLHREFNERTRSDAAWQAQLKALTRKAQIAATPSARDAVKAELIAKFKAKAAYLLDPVRNESVKGILSRRAAQIKSTSDAQHQRLATAAAQRQPGAPGAAVPQNAQSAKPNGSGAKAFSDFFDKALA